MPIKKFFFPLFLIGALVVAGCTPSTSQLHIPSISGQETSDPKLAIASHYRSEELSLRPNAPSYELPLEEKNIANFHEVLSVVGLNENQKRLLKANGFVVIPWSGDDIVAPYQTLNQQGVPIFVTSDTLLHLYHIQFNEILRRVEEEQFFDQLIDLSLAMLHQAMQDYQSFVNADLKEAARRNVAYFAVALKLLQTPTEGYNEEQIKEEIQKWNEEHPGDKKQFKPLRKVEFTVPDYVVEEVAQEIDNITRHEGLKPSAIFNSRKDCDCGFLPCYCEDYSQYIPRGHYTQSEALKRYFTAMMWYGRIAFLLKGGSDALVNEYDAYIATIQASLLSAELPNVPISQQQESVTCWDVWHQIYSITAFFVGTADDLTPYEYLAALEKVFGTSFDVSALTSEETQLKLKAELAQMTNPQIYGGSGICTILPPVTKEKLAQCLAKTKGMRFIGQRFVPDSYIFQNLVSPAVGMYSGRGEPFTMKMTPLGPARCFPRGLDIVAVLGSERACHILQAEGDTEYRGENTSYQRQLEELRQEFVTFTESDWNRNLYWGWLYALKPLLEEVSAGYPTFMQTQAWRDKQLQTALASWTELRHDTILYAKQSYTPGLTSIMPQPKPPRGYVEPVPELYSRLLSLTTMTREGLQDLGVLSDSEKSRLQSLETILQRLIRISQDELESDPLTEDDYDFIRNFAEELNDIVVGIGARGKETTLVADVHTDLNSPMEVLEEGVGYVDLIVVAYEVPEGDILLGAGPALSYYEFKQPIGERLTDEQWKDMLQRGQQPPRPGWINSFYAS
jgi:hypothetical protein